MASCRSCIDFFAYQVGEVTEEAHRLLFWLRVILSMVSMVKITGYRDSTLFDHDTIIYSYFILVVLHQNRGDDAA